jgi:serine/threonine-protein phosphatase PGAM5
MATRTVYLVRHGQHQYIEPMRGAQSEGLDVGLTPLGEEQANRLGERLSPLPIGAIHTSPLPRAIQTAEIVAHRLPAASLHTSDLLAECLPCVPPPPQDRVFLRRYPPEQIAADRDRAEEVFDRYLKTARITDKHQVLICHSNLIRYLTARVLGAPPEALTYSMEICNGSITEVLIRSNGRMDLVSFNDVGYLPYAMMTCLGARQFAADQARDGAVSVPSEQRRLTAET